MARLCLWRPGHRAKSEDETLSRRDGIKGHSRRCVHSRGCSSGMQLTLHADYALRTLLYLGSHPGRPVPTQEISRSYGISRHHLVRVVQRLSDTGYVSVTPGRYGGAVLARDPSKIRIGDVVRSTETLSLIHI